jgi:hypothetical protein
MADAIKDVLAFLCCGKFIHFYKIDDILEYVVVFADELFNFGEMDVLPLALTRGHDL